jgi:hypothetical protein
MLRNMSLYEICKINEYILSDNDLQYILLYVTHIMKLMHIWL